MIDLTPLEVRQKKGDFRRAFRGYDEELVNDFLDLVADRMEQLVRQNMDLADRSDALEEELAGYRDKERSLADALMTAQELQEGARKHAQKEAELLMKQARLDADEARQEADLALIRERETLRQVRARRAQLVKSFRRMLEREIAELDVIEETLELDTGDDGGATPAPHAAGPADDDVPPLDQDAAEAGLEPIDGGFEETRDGGEELGRTAAMSLDPAAGPAETPVEDAAPEDEAPEPEPEEERPAGLETSAAPTEEDEEVEPLPPLEREYPQFPGGTPSSKPSAGAGEPEGETGGEDDGEDDWLASLMEEDDDR